MVAVKLYTKIPCSLCDHVKDELSSLAQTYPHILEEVDITKNHETFARYRFMIPVVEIGPTILKAPISRIDLVRAFMVLGSQKQDK